MWFHTLKIYEFDQSKCIFLGSQFLKSTKSVMTLKRNFRLRLKKLDPNLIKTAKITTFQFGSSTTIHGIAYIFDQGIQACDRLLWLILVCFGAGLAIHMSHEAWTDWKSRFYEVVLRDAMF